MKLVGGQCVQSSQYLGSTSDLAHVPAAEQVVSQLDHLILQQRYVCHLMIPTAYTEDVVREGVLIAPVT